MRNFVTAQEMKQIEKNAAAKGLSYYQMMENAGNAAVDFILKNFSDYLTRILVLTGKGNNGGDGYVAARILAEQGYPTSILMVDGEPLTEDSQKNYFLCKKMNIELHPLSENFLKHKLEHFSLVIDALYGTGFHGELQPHAATVTSAINAHSSKVIALDIPSGVNGDTANADKNAIHADYTIAFDSLKYAHIVSSAAVYCGKVICADIGIPQSCHLL